MNTSLRQLRRRSQGAAAVEFALLVVTILPLLLAVVLFFGRYFWHYTVAAKAASDTAVFLAAASPAELKIYGPGGVPPIVAAARLIGETEIAELSPGTYPATVTVYCDGVQCIASRPLPQTLTVWVTASMEDPFLTGISKALGNDRPLAIPLNAVTRISYVAN